MKGGDIYMNKQLEKYARQMLKDGLAKLSEGNRTFSNGCIHIKI